MKKVNLFIQTETKTKTKTQTQTQTETQTETKTKTETETKTLPLRSSFLFLWQCVNPRPKVGHSVHVYKPLAKRFNFAQSAVFNGIHKAPAISDP